MLHNTCIVGNIASICLHTSDSAESHMQQQRDKATGQRRVLFRLHACCIGLLRPESNGSRHVGPYVLAIP